MQDENWQYYSVQRQEATLEENQAEAVDLSWCAFLCALPCIPPTRGALLLGYVLCVIMTSWVNSHLVNILSCDTKPYFRICQYSWFPYPGLFPPPPPTISDFSLRPNAFQGTLNMMVSLGQGIISRKWRYHQHRDLVPPPKSSNTEMPEKPRLQVCGLHTSLSI